MRFLRTLTLMIASTSTAIALADQLPIREQFLKSNPAVSADEIEAMRGMYDCSDDSENGKGVILNFDRGPLIFGAIVDHERAEVRSSANGLFLLLHAKSAA